MTLSKNGLALKLNRYIWRYGASASLYVVGQVSIPAENQQSLPYPTKS
jgi:hypothetical protein